MYAQAAWLYNQFGRAASRCAPPRAAGVEDELSLLRAQWNLVNPVHREPRITHGWGFVDVRGTNVAVGWSNTARLANAALFTRNCFVGPAAGSALRRGNRNVIVGDYPGPTAADGTVALGTTATDGTWRGVRWTDGSPNAIQTVGANDAPLVDDGTMSATYVRGEQKHRCPRYRPKYQSPALPRPPCGAGCDRRPRGRGHGRWHHRSVRLPPSMVPYRRPRRWAENEPCRRQDDADARYAARAVGDRLTGAGTARTVVLGPPPGRTLPGRKGDAIVRSADAARQHRCGGHR